MAYENGDNYYNYCFKVAKRYAEDDLIFIKALQIIQYMQTRPDYPLCFEEINNATEKILGETIYGLSRTFGCWDSSAMHWNFDEAAEFLPKTFTEEMSKKFECEMDAFSIATRPLMVDMFSQNFLNSSSIKQVSYLKNDNGFLIRIIKNDYSNFDICCSKDELKRLVSSLQEVLADE